MDNKELIEALLAFPDTVHSPRQAAQVIAAQDARIAELEAEAELLRTDFEKALGADVCSSCEGCGVSFLADDDYVSNPDGISGCWHTMTDEKSKRERPCYAYRVGMPDARKALEHP